MIPDDDLEARLRGVHPPEPPRELILRLRAAEPSMPATADEPFLSLSWRWAYVGVLAAWAVVAILRLLTAPLLPPGAANVSTIAQTPPLSPTIHPDPAEWTILLTSNRNSDPTWP